MKFSIVDENEKLLWEREFDREEVVQTLKELRGDKAPGVDGFTMAFFQHYWRVVQVDIMAFFKEFHESYMFEKCVN